MEKQNQSPKLVGQGVENICETCGCKFMTADIHETECLGCKIIREMKLPADTIVNHSVLNIYMSGNFDREHGVDPIYLKIAEGVALLDRKRGKEQLCSSVHFFGEKHNDEIESYVSMVIKDSKYRRKYDAMVFVKVTSYSNFMVFGISFSDRMANKLKDKDTRFVKGFAISIAIKWYYRDRM